MDDEKKIDDLVKMLDEGFAKGVGHVNVDTDEPIEDRSDHGMYGLFQNSPGMQCSNSSPRTG